MLKKERGIKSSLDLMIGDSGREVKNNMNDLKGIDKNAR
jgi:hypothetical protein